MQFASLTFKSGTAARPHRIEEPIVYDNFDGYTQLAAELKTPNQIAENFYGARDLHKALQSKACDYVMRIDEAGEGGGHNNTCLTKPFPERCGSNEDAGKD